MTAKCRSWTPEEDALLRAHPDLSNAELARRLGRTVPSVANRRQRLGLTGPKGPPWTPEDDQRLGELWGQRPASEIARILSRSLDAVVLRAKRLGLGPSSLAAGTWTARMVARALRVDDKAVTRWICQGLLRARELPPRSPAGEARPRRIWLVTPTDLARFLEAHPDRWEASRCPGLLRTLWPDPPDWLRRKLEAEARWRTVVPRDRAKWSPEDDRALLELKAAGKTHAEIGRILGRSAEAVTHRLARLGADTPRRRAAACRTGRPA